MFRIAGYVFEGAINFCALNSGKGIAVVVPADTSVSVMEQLKNATLIEVLDAGDEVFFHSVCGNFLGQRYDYFSGRTSKISFRSQELQYRRASERT